MNRADGHPETTSPTKGRFQVPLDLMPLSCVIFDASHNPVDCNLEAVRLFGFEAKRDFLEAFWDNAPPRQPNGKESKAALNEALALAFESGKAYCDWLHYDRSHEEMQLDLTLARVPLGDDFIVFSFAHDIRDKVQEARIREQAEKQTQLMLDSTPMICSIWGNDGRMIDCNLEALRLLQLDSKEEYINHFDHFNPAYQPDGEPSRTKAAEMIRLAFESGRIQFEWEYLTGKGDPLPVEVTLICVEWEGERRLLAYSRDLREVLRARNEEEQAERRTLLMLDTLPMATYLISRQHQLVDCNMEAVRMFQAKGKSHLINSFLDDFSPTYQPDGQFSRIKAKREIDEAYRNGYALFEWTHRMPDGKAIPTEITLIKVPWSQDGDLLCAYARDLRQVKRAEGELLHKTRLLETVSDLAVRLMPSPPQKLSEDLSKSMEIMAQSVNADKVNIWKNVEMGGAPCYQLVQSWPSEEDAEEWAPKNYDSLPYWKKMVFRNRIINGPVTELPKAERTLLTQKGVKSLLSIPIIIWDQVWGFISFDDYHHTCSFSESEEHVLRSSSTLLAFAMYRHSMTQELTETNEMLLKQRNMLAAVNEVAEIILASEQGDFPLVIQQSLKILGESVGADRASIWKNNLDKDGVLRASRLPGWVEGKSFAESEYGIGLNVYDYVPQWMNSSNNLPVVEQTLDEMSDDLKQLSILQGIAALLLIPLVLQDNFWGFVGYAHRMSGYRFREEERNILRSGSMMIAESIMRNEIADNLQRVEEVAATDPLTGLMNRASFLPRAERMFEKRRRKMQPCAVLFLDIDHFKAVNDNYGHAFGDEVLVRFADVLKGSTRPDDLCCRFGGEEFVVMLAESAKETAATVAERILSNTASARFESQPDFRFTTSIGLMSGVPDKQAYLQDYIEKADSALYAAKEGGRNRVVNYTAPT